MKIKTIKDIVFVKLGITAWQRSHNRIPRVLFYHGASNVTDPFVQGLHIAPEALKKQLDYLLKHYEIISMEEYDHRFTSGTFNGKEITLTFDDGYQNNLTVLAPILKELSLPFTVFISTNHIDSGNRFATFIGRAVIMTPTLSRLQIPCINLDLSLTTPRQRKKTFKKVSRKLKHSDIETVDLISKQIIENISGQEYQTLCQQYLSDAPMNWDEVATLQKEYNCTIGSHCLDHFICGPFQQTEEIKKQIIHSKEMIEKRLNTPCFYLAYPNGDIDDRALKAVADAGYKLAFTTNSNIRLRPDSNPFALPRYGVSFKLNTFKTELAFKPKPNTKK